MSSENNQDVNKSFPDIEQETNTTENQTEPKCNDNCIPLTPEEIAVQQILWVNKMYAIQMAEYWQS